MDNGLLVHPCYLNEMEKNYDRRMSFRNRGDDAPPI